MKTLKSKATAILIAALLTFSMTASMILIPSANAHSPPWNIKTYAFCSASPDPVGVGQSLRVNLWINMPPPTASGAYGDRYQGMTVKVTLPDGTTTTLGPFTSDDTGGAHTTYAPTEVGNYTFQFIYPGQTLTGANPPPTGFSATAQPFIGDYMEPLTSNIATVTVQTAPVGYPPITPLPTNYWTRPINAMNNNWYTIGGNWLGFLQMNFANTGGYNGSENYNAYTTAPTTGHILWTKPVAFGGTVGGEFGGTETSNFYSTAQYEPKWAPIIMDGIMYYTEYPTSSTNPTGWAAIDLKTGQTIWTEDTPLCLPSPSTPVNQVLTTPVTETPTEGPCTVLRCGQILDFVTPNQYGSLAYLWSTGTPACVAAVTNIAAGSTTYNMFDAMTGMYILSIVNGTSFADSLTEDAQGDLIGYYVNYTNANAPTLNEWNSTQAILYPNGYIPGHTSISWTWRPIQGAVIPFKSGVMWTVPLPTTLNGQPLLGINGITPTSFGITAVDSGVVFVRAPTGGFFNNGFMYEAGYSMSTGAQLWFVNRTEPAETLVASSGGSIYAGDGVYVEIPQGAEIINCYSLTTGKLLWGPISLPNARPYDSLGINDIIANGTCYIYGYGGDVWAYNIANGALEWHYQTPSGGFESPYGYYSIWIFNLGTVAGGELFVPEGHMYSPPLYRGCQQLALNITNGQVVWSIDGFDTTCGPAVVDGVMTTVNCYDNQIYAYGMGPSKTTVTAPSVSVTTATPITITGTVMDTSAGSQQNAVAANFPNGLPCVSDASMSQFMEGVYMQQPMPTNLTGVPVTISVTDSNGNHYNIGTAVTNPYTGTYGLTWTPIIPSNFTVTATFAGTQSYYGSSASTYFYASAPAPTASPAPVAAQLPTGTYVAEAAAAIIVVVIIIGAVIMLMLRKRP